jgi:hypothetical protein
LPLLSMVNSLAGGADWTRAGKAAADSAVRATNNLLRKADTKLVPGIGIISDLLLNEFVARRLTVPDTGKAAAAHGTIGPVPAKTTDAHANRSGVGVVNHSAVCGKKSMATYRDREIGLGREGKVLSRAVSRRAGT